jgi:catechol 2,3-dioxygenase-like lactoylglutathione lyase family enzyme
VTRPTAHHVGIPVTDLERSFDFYRDTFDLDVAARFSVAGTAFETGVGVPGASADFVQLDAGGCRIELVEYDPTGTDRRGGHPNDPGTTHVGLAVDDLDAFYAGLDDAVETLSAPQLTESGTRILFVRDPDEHLIEVLEL